MTLSRRRFLELAAAAGASLALSGCTDSERVDTAADAGEPAGGSDASMPINPGAHVAGVAAFVTVDQRRAAVRRAVELAGGMPWMRPGDRVLIKPAHNSYTPYPFTASSVSVSEIAQMCLEAGAGQVVIADVMGIEHTLVPGGWALESKYGRSLAFDASKDATVRAFHESGLWQGVADRVGETNIGADKSVHLTSFRELNWRRYESASDTPGGEANARLFSPWVKDQLANAITLQGKNKSIPYFPRKFDFLREQVPGMYIPRLFDEVDHVINVARVATHIMSHFSTATKNWIGCMRPDDRLWMHQLTFLMNQRHGADDPARTEPPYHEILPELHLSTWQRQRLIFADASDVVISGGPDETPDPTYPARLMLATSDLVSADVLNLAVLRMGVLAAVAEGGLAGQCEPQPDDYPEVIYEYIKHKLQLREDNLMRGTDTKLCDPLFSNWDWLAIRRARELGLGAASPADVAINFAADGDFAVPASQREWIDLDVHRAPSFPLQA